MFMNEYSHGIDAKGRLIIPSKMREQCGASVIITRGFEGCLAVYTLEGWEAYYTRINSLPNNSKETRSLIRMMTSRTCECEFDKLGRINLPKPLIELAQIEKDCAIIGAGDHIEIWDQARWNSYYEDISDDFEENYDSLENL